MLKTPIDRRVITFYSFKGGVGRTMAMANAAFRLANRHGLRVIAVDWDLEAPGLHRFFGVSSDAAAKSHGVLDYFRAWKTAKKKQADAPPDVSEWLIPITDEKHKPKFGSLSLLTAGKQDKNYDARLAKFNWQSFYAKDAGAAAVETLREQLVSQADIILIDSRTGLTDAGGICSIQIPDGVVLMTAPNMQSLEGTERIARSIANAPKESRAGRGKARMWLAVSRVPSMEASDAARAWFAEHEAWFAKNMKEGLWQTDDHTGGLRSHEIPYQARWGFDEVVLSEVNKADARDPLTQAYDQLTETVMRWVRGEPPLVIETRAKDAPGAAGERSIEALDAEVAEAEMRGDMLGMARSLLNVSRQLVRHDRPDEAVGKAEQARGIFLSRGAKIDYDSALFDVVSALTQAERFTEAAQLLTRALTLGLSQGDTGRRALLLYQLAEVRVRLNDSKTALRLLKDARAIERDSEDAEFARSLSYLIGSVYEDMANWKEAARMYRKYSTRARAVQDVVSERDAIQRLLEFSDAGKHPLPDAPALRARLAELQAAAPKDE